jgi:hypothetical protein
VYSSQNVVLTVINWFPKISQGSHKLSVEVSQGAKQIVSRLRIRPGVKNANLHELLLSCRSYAPRTSSVSLAHLFLLHIINTRIKYFLFLTFNYVD